MAHSTKLEYNVIKMIQFGYVVLIRRSVYMSLLLYVHQKRDAFSLSLSLPSHQGSLLSLPNFVTYPVCFLTAYKMMSCPSFLAQVLDSKNPGLHYLDIYYCRSNVYMSVAPFSNLNLACFKKRLFFNILRQFLIFF